MRKAFTVIEVMLAVMIVSVVIGALLKLYSNNTTVFHSYEPVVNASLEATLVIGSENRGLENESISMDELLKGFKLDDALRQSLKNRRIDIGYQDRLEIDLDQVLGTSGNTDPDGGNDDGSTDMPSSLKLGMTTVESNGQQLRLIRISTQ